MRAQDFNIRESKNRLSHNYTIGDKVLVCIGFTVVSKKLSRSTEGPYSITKVYKNGTIKINKGTYEEIINIRRVKAFKE